MAIWSRGLAAKSTQNSVQIVEFTATSLRFADAAPAQAPAYLLPSEWQSKQKFNELVPVGYLFSPLCTLFISALV